ncbi:hypothetical protein [Kaistia sp. MMO-174]|uniref:hypothetical protein n=1 Tax=Kaistia sp. MMO-174 TaxID=3081256 RepID=UPI003015C883
MADYSNFLFNAFGGIGDQLVQNRQERRRNMEDDRNYARALGLDEWRKQTDQRDYDRGVLTSDRAYNRGVMENDRSYGLQERNYQRGVLESDRNYELARQQADRRDAPRIDTFYDPGTGQEIKGIYNPNAPGGFVPVGGAKAAPAQRQQSLMAGDRKAVLEADENAQAGQGVINALTRAKDLNDQAYSGWAAGPRGYVSSLWGSEAGQATQELDNVVTAQALDQLKSTFGAAPTEGERKILLDIQGSVNQAPEVRKRIYDRAIAAAQRRIDFNRKQAAALRSGQYYSPDYAGPAFSDQVPQGGGQQGALDTSSAIDLARQAIQAGADPQAVIERLQQAGIDPGGL